MIKRFNGKACYQPTGKAAEYSKWACNLFTGCSAMCHYCYCKSILRGIWTDKPVLKKSLVNEEMAFEIFKKEAIQNLPELQKHGLFFNFVSDPFLPETIDLNVKAIRYCVERNIPVKVLTKQIWWINKGWLNTIAADHPQIAFGFTLTGHDELEPGAAPNVARIEAIRHLNFRKFITWASIEPIINLDDSLEMIRKTQGACSLYKIGLKSGAKYNQAELEKFIDTVISENPYSKIYFKDSLLEQAGIRRQYLPAFNCVTRNYNIFDGKDYPDQSTER